jgi:hypothetical protein
VLEKNGLCVEADNLEDYGIDSDPTYSTKIISTSWILDTVVVQCLDRGGKGGMVEGVGPWYLYAISL